MDSIAVLGGTFNPIHIGHLNTALELLDQLPLTEIRFMPSARPPHRKPPAVNLEIRAAMIELAIAENPRLACDRREARREGPSYTADSLEELRAELGPSAPLIFLLGMDAFCSLPSWHRSSELLNFAHLLVVARPGFEAPKSDWVATLIKAAVAPDALFDEPYGNVAQIALTPQPVSSTSLRALLQSGLDASASLPEPVNRFIRERGLYRVSKDHGS
ncbi:MAG: nicotinate-nucleotide adenylyltransferase [Pseudomonadota bacterium]